MKKAILLFSIAFIAYSSFGQTTVNLTASKDNTLYESATGNLSNGAGDFLFVGQTDQGANGNSRRALVNFDVSSIPSTAVITSVSLSLEVTRRASATSQTVSVHRVNADWGEGGSHAAGQEGAGTTPQTNDATWLHTFFNTGLWSTPGGDYNSSASASTLISALGNYSWSSNQMIIDVTNWVNGSSPNYGWIVLGNESTPETAYQIQSRTNSATQSRPKLTVTYTNGSVCDTNLTVSGTIGSGTYQASNDVTITGTVASNAVAIFRAGNSINMNINSQVNSGAEVDMIIGPCN